ncbi:hypothetical protein PACILC2_21150 [Paenibacillus cisolokensis]|uniref:Uncharacterized protein n=1 Tax=Paenibacillus cisolokensis TaxID=1658519 RepID=A0ABQ4N5V9_9BACL|nr:hypothetical protein [Paenibacillus cisolokensis]GIQ63547.1 hypothetical protein PACILC2_21150 [Paenibacillus cisolokensis]
MTKGKRDFARDRVICEAATPGPWIARAWTVPTNDQFNVGTEDADLATFWQGKRYAGSREVSAEEARSNTVFVAEAREGWPAALDEIERLREDYRKLQNVYFENYARACEFDGEIQRLRAALEKVLQHEAVDISFNGVRIRDIIQEAISTTTERGESKCVNT